MLKCSLFDTGTSTSILSLDIAKELKIDIKPVDQITLRLANGEEMVVNEVEYIWLEVNMKGTDPPPGSWWR